MSNRISFSESLEKCKHCARNPGVVTKMKMEVNPLSMLENVDDVKKLEFLKKCIHHISDASSVSLTELCESVPEIDPASVMMCFSAVIKNAENYVTNERDDIDEHLLQILKAESEKVTNGFKDRFLAEQEKLLNFDWKANLVLESNSISNLNEPLVTMSFSVKNKADVIVECNEEELDSLIQELEKARSEAQSILS